MIKVKAVQTFRDKNNTIIGYSLADSKGNVKKMKSKELKAAIKNGKVEVVNLTLTKDNRLVHTSIKTEKSSSGKRNVAVRVSRNKEVNNTNLRDKKENNVNDIFDIVKDERGVVLRGVKVDKNSLTHIEIPRGVTYLDYECFAECSNVKYVSIPNTVKIIGTRCFADCSSLKSICIPESVEKLGYYDLDKGEECLPGCFLNCSSLESVVIKNPNIKICDNQTFGCCTSLYDVRLPKGYSGTLYIAFGGCTALSHIDIPENTETSWYAFEGCSSLKSVRLPKHGIKFDGCFEGCISLESVTFNKDNKEDTLGYRYFAGCESLKSIVIPNTVEEICQECFDGCVLLASVYIPKSVKKIHENCFRGCSKLVVTCDKGSYAEEYCKSHNIRFKHETLFNSDMFDIVEEDGEVLLKGFKCKVNCGRIELPDGITALGDCCFKGFKYLDSISIPNSVKIIGAECFRDCKSLKSIVIPESVEWIGYRNRDEECPVEDGCFSGCTSLASVKICNPSISINDYDTFYGCTSLKNVEFHKDYTGSLDGTFDGCTSLEHIDLPDGVLINPYAFYKCSALKSIKVPRGTDCLGDYAFGGCTSLESIILPDTCIECDGECFSGCKSLKSIYIPDSVTFIGGLEDSPNVVVTCNPNSYAEKYCKENNIKYKYR